MNDTPPPAPRLFGQHVVTPASGPDERVTFLVWGKSGCGKTALASTLPGRILWIGFDPDGEKTIAGASHVDFIGMAGALPDAVPQFAEGEVYERQLGDMLRARPEIKSVVVDSMTSYAQLCLTYAITSGKAGGGKFKSTMDNPGPTAYGIRNRNTLTFVRMVLRVTARFNRHCMFICHEDEPEKQADDKGQLQIIKITLLLGGTLPGELPLQISEVWFMRDNGIRRELFMRPFGVTVPMKTRMFRTDKKSVIPWTYNMYDGTGSTVAQWIDQWYTGGPGYKLPL
jgi:hypothetical protein